MVSQARIWSLTVWLFLHSDIKLFVKALNKACQELYSLRFETIAQYLTVYLL